MTREERAKDYAKHNIDTNDFANLYNAYLGAMEETKELEKENAELKEKLKPENCLKLLAKGGYVQFTNDNLTKAKELVRSLYYIIQARINYENNIGIKDEMWRAEQFLSC